MLSRNKEEHYTSHQVDGQELHALQPGRFSIQANEWEKNGCQPQDSQFKRLENQVQLSWKEKADQHQYRRDKGSYLN